MIRCVWLNSLALVAAMLLASGAASLGAAEKKAKAVAPHAGHAAHFEHCAKACATCMRECESCATHCALLVSQGKKEHLLTLGTCADCAEFCAAAAKIVSRGGPMMFGICQSCAKACDTCGAACEKVSSDAHMQRCAKACRECAVACREMLKHVGLAPGASTGAGAAAR